MESHGLTGRIWKASKEHSHVFCQGLRWDWMGCSRIAVRAIGGEGSHPRIEISTIPGVDIRTDNLRNFHAYHLIRNGLGVVCQSLGALTARVPSSGTVS
jgi:hypothetical protein